MGVADWVFPSCEAVHREAPRVEEAGHLQPDSQLRALYAVCPPHLLAPLRLEGPSRADEQRRRRKFLISSAIQM